MKDKIMKLTNCSGFSELIAALLLFGIGAFFGFVALQDSKVKSQVPVELSTMTVADCAKKTHVTGNVTATIGAYWESYESVNGVKRESSAERIYLVPFGDKGQFIGVNVRSHDFDSMEALMEATSASDDLYSMTEAAMSIDGYVKKCDTRMKKELENAYISSGGTGNYETVFVPYYIERVAVGSSAFMYIIAGVFALVGAVFVARFVMTYKKEEATMTGRNAYVGRVIFDRDQLASEEDM